MRIKNLRGGSVRSDLKKLDSFTLETSKNKLIRNFMRNGHVRSNDQFMKLFSMKAHEDLIRLNNPIFTLETFHELLC